MFADVKLLGIDTLNKQLFIQKFKIPDCKIDTLSFKDINLIKIDNGTYLKEGLIAGVTIGGIIGLCSIKSNVSKNENNSRVISGL